MKHLKTIFACLLTTVLSFGQMWGGTATYSMTPDASTTGSSATSYQSSLTFTYGGIGWAMAQINPSTLQTKTNQTNPTAEFNFHNTSAFPGRITQVVVKYKALTIATGKQSEFMFLGGTSAITATTGGTSGTWNSTDKTFTWTPASNTNYTYFAFYMNGKTATGNNYLAESDAIVVTYDDGGSTPTCATPSFSPVAGTYTSAQNVSITCSTSGATIYYTTDGSTPTTSSNVYSSAIEVSSSLTLKAIATKSGNSNSEVAEAAYVINTQSGDTEEGWVATAISDIGSTDKVVITMSKDNVYYALTGGKGASSAPAATVVTVANDKITSEVSNAIKWNIVTNNGSYTIYPNGDANSWLYCTATNNGVRVGTNDNKAFTISEENYLKNTGTSRYVGVYNNADWRCYTSINSNITGQTLTFFKYVSAGGASKENAGLTYDAADQKKLTKFGDAFTAPTLTNPHDVAVTYASDNTDVATVADNGAVTIKAAGVAVITASFSGNDDYNEGSASYAICVVNHVGTEADPFNVADARRVIDAFGTKEGVYMSGIVSQITTAYDETYHNISFDISEDGSTGVSQVRAFRCKGLDNTDFTSEDDVKSGATVTVYGNLTKYNSTYEFEAGCYLTAYEAPEVPKQSIANTKETAYTVAQALVYAADGLTYDLDDYVYVGGVVKKVESFNNGAMNIFIKDADAENEFELFKCAGINDGSSTTPFEALTDVQEGDEIIGYGQMIDYNGVKEFKQGNYLVELTRPEVAVSSVSLPSAETIEEGETVTLAATVLPENATNKSITWSVQSGSDYASVAEDGKVTGIAAGQAVIRATSAADATKYAECTITVTAGDPTVHKVTFDATVDKTTENTELSITKSNVTIAVTKGDGRFNNGTDYRPYKTSEFTVSCSNGNITKIEFTCTSSKPITGFSDVEGLDKTNEVWTGNADSVSFTASGAQVQMTQLVVTYKEESRAESGLAWSTDAVELTVGDAFTAPTLSNPNSIAAADITIASNNTALATVNAGVVSLVENATGTATITATFAGNDNYKPVTVSYSITVNAAAPAPLTDYYEKVTETAGIVEGTYLIVYEDGNVAFNGSLETLDAESNTIAVEITNDKKIAVTEQTAAATFYIDPIAGTVKSASNHYIGVSSWSNGLKQTDTYVHNVLEIDGDGNAQVGIYNADWNTTGGTMRLQYNKSDGQKRFRYYKNGGQQSIALYKLHGESVKASPELAWSGDVEITIGDEFTAPTLSHAAGITGTITYTSDKETLATVDENGVISLVENATGTAKITASYDGDTNFKDGSAVCTIKVNPAHSIYVSPSLTVNFGSVVKDATVEDKDITVTLTGVDAATATLGGTNPEVFSFTPAALTASGDITISVASTATVGEFSAKLTISDDAGLATSRDVTLKLTVTDPATVETPISTTSKWVAATAADLVDGKEVLITGVKDEVVYAMGEQKSTNRAAYVATVDGEGVLTPGEGTMSFTLVAQGDGTYAIRTSDGKYLYAAGSGANHLKTQDAVDVNAQWTLTIASAVATGSSNRNVMQFNGGSSKLFSCYASDSQEDIQFYVPKQADPTPDDPQPETPDTMREVTANRYGTICIPHGGRIVDAILFEVSWYNGEKIFFDEIVNGTMLPGRPYIFWPKNNATQIGVIYSDEAVAAEAGNWRGLYGSFTEQAIEIVENPEPGEGNYILYANKYYLVNSEAYVGANRAYIKLGEVPTTEPTQAPGRRRVSMQVEGEQVATDILNAELNAQPMKVVIDNQLFIIREGKMYDMTGRLVK